MLLRGAACAVMPRRMQASSRSIARTNPGFAFVGSASGAIHVVRVEDGRLQEIQRIASRSPAHLAIHPDGKFLLAANAVHEHDGLPQATLETYSLGQRSGCLNLCSRQALSLSATDARHFAITPDGQHVAVAAYAGGLYNVLPIGADGVLGLVTSIRKEVGCGPVTTHQASAHPHTLQFDPSGQYLVGTDFGADRLNVLALIGGKLVRHAHVQLPAGAGPASVVFHPSGSFFYVAHALTGHVFCYQFQASEKRISSTSAPVAVLPVIAPETGTILAMHADGRFLYGSGPNPGFISCYAVDEQSGALAKVEEIRVAGGAIHSLTSTSGYLHIVDRSGSRIHTLKLNRNGAGFAGKSHSFAIEEPMSLALLPATS